MSFGSKATGLVTGAGCEAAGVGSTVAGYWAGEVGSAIRGLYPGRNFSS